MDFFEHEERARRATRLLVVLFFLAVVTLVGGLDLAAWIGMEYVNDLFDYRWSVIAWLSAATLFLIACGSAYKAATLASGGETVALMLGAHPVSPSPTSPADRMLTNVVEEMAIASGTPPPRVHVLEDPGINAFAAGHSASDAVVVVTRGCLDNLSRDELQGVVAHEFSHLLNGDMRLNLRLIGLLHGILLIALSGRLLMRLGSGGRSSKGNGYIVLVGAVVAAIGYGGWFFGQLIKAAVSREREFLADASAVQFTRNPSGIGGALKKIGLGSYHSYLANDNAEQFSHLYFANGVRASVFGMFATHPPLEERIRAIDPAWDGQWTQLAPIAPQAAEPAPRQGARVPLAAEAIAGRVGRISPDHVAFGAALLAAMPPALSEAARVPFSARAAALALLIQAADDRGEAQLARIRASNSVLAAEVEKLRGAIAKLGPSARLPLLDLCIPTLRQLTPSQRDGFLECLSAAASGELPLAEYALVRVLRVHLSVDPRSNGQIMSVRPLLPGLAVVLGELARAGAADEGRAKEAFAAACARLLEPDESLPMPTTRASCAELDRALALLGTASPGIKRRVLTACAWCVSSDGTVTVEEAELVRAIADCLGCPLPPFLDRPVPT